MSCTNNKLNRLKSAVEPNKYALFGVLSDTNIFKYATSEIIRFAFLLTDESLPSLAKKVPDLLNYSDTNRVIDYNSDVNTQLYTLFCINDKNQQYIKEVLTSKKMIDN